MILDDLIIIARYTEHASPRSVYERSLRCDLAWPQFSSVSAEELELPLAYAMTVFSDARNIELSLATIFRPQNSYCLHIDPKSDHMFRCRKDFGYLDETRFTMHYRETVENIMACYRSKYPGSYIFSSSQSVSVAWGQFSIVQAELHCLKDLLNNGRTWSYALDLAGSEVVLLTNRELVANLSANLGQIYTESFPMPVHNLKRIQRRYKLDLKNRLRPVGFHTPPPFGLTIYKGAKAWRVPRSFVEFLFKHPVAKEFIG